MSAPYPFARAVRAASGLLRKAVFGSVPKLFDAPYYCERNPRVAKSGFDPFLHYVWFGARAGRNPNPDFDTAFYRSQSGSTRLDPVRHYLRVGAREGLDPSPSFSTSLYLARYPDVVKAGINPLLHFRTDGRGEGREAVPSPIASDRLRALDGVPPEHERTFPSSSKGRFALTLLRASPIAPETAFAPRLCLHLCVDGAAYAALLEAFRVFETGPQDEIALRIDTGVGQHPPMPTQLLAFERCFHRTSENGREVVLRFAELKVWDLRPKKPEVAAVFAGGCFSACDLGKGDNWMYRDTR